MDKKNDKCFLPTTLAGWLTVISLIIGITGCLYSVIIKPYNYFVGLERRILHLEIKEKEIDKAVNVIYNYIERKYGFNSEVI